jgi:hypothetical protein
VQIAFVLKGADALCDIRNSASPCKSSLVFILTISLQLRSNFSKSLHCSSDLFSIPIQPCFRPWYKDKVAFILIDYSISNS